MSDLVAFLRARLNDDEQAAKAAALTFGGASHWEADQVNDPDYGIQRFMHIGDRTLTAGLPGDEEDPLRSDELAHIVRHDPARVLAEVEAKRLIVGEHRQSMPGWCVTCDAPGDQAGRLHGCTTLRLLALPYADHPAYRAEWRP